MLVLLRNEENKCLKSNRISKYVLVGVRRWCIGMKYEGDGLRGLKYKVGYEGVY